MNKENILQKVFDLNENVKCCDQLLIDIGHFNYVAETHKTAIDKIRKDIHFIRSECIKFYENIRNEHDSSKSNIIIEEKK